MRGGQMPILWIGSWQICPLSQTASWDIGGNPCPRFMDCISILLCCKTLTRGVIWGRKQCPLRDFYFKFSGPEPGSLHVNIFQTIQEFLNYLMKQNFVKACYDLYILLREAFCMRQGGCSRSWRHTSEVLEQWIPLSSFQWVSSDNSLECKKFVSGWKQMLCGCRNFSFMW